MLSRIWSGFFIVAFISAMVQWLVFDHVLIFEEIVNAIFSMSKVTVEIAIGLIGILSFWLGMMKIAEHAGIIDKLANFISPLFTRLMPNVPKGHPAIGSMTMNLSANFLGLDNAATPLGLKAMQDLQSLNPDKETASDAQILFLVLNTSAVTLFPVTVFIYPRSTRCAQSYRCFYTYFIGHFCINTLRFICCGICSENKIISTSYFTLPSCGYCDHWRHCGLF